MQGSMRRIIRTTAITALALCLLSEATMAGNRLSLRKNAGTEIVVDLSNSEGVAGAQFSLCARGGLVLHSFEPSDRLTTAGVAVYQSLAGDSSLNIVLLAPVRSFLPCGDGSIGTVSFTRAAGLLNDSAQIHLQNVLLCDVAARSLEISTTDVNWLLNDRANAASASGSTLKLEQNYPNPFNPSTTISYRLDQAAHVRLAVYDVAGRLVNLLVDNEELAGHHAVRWNVEGGTNGPLASGLYIARFTVGGEVAVIKMILTK